MLLKSVSILSVLAAITQANSIRVSDTERKEEALALLKLARQPRRNHGTFEELKGDDFERECNQEICDREELDEIFPDKVEGDKKWRELTDQCSLNPCNSEGTAKCVQRWKARSCICKEHVDGVDTVGGVARFTGETCAEDFNECEDAAANTKCGDRHCINTHGSFECGCEDGYEADESGKCVDIDECARGIDSCGANAKCVNDQGSHHCECDIGFEADPEDPNSCIDTDECQDPDTCPSVGLSKKCENTIGSYKCICAEAGYSDDNGSCVDIDECATSCNALAEVCFNNPGSFSCSCELGYDRVNGTCIDVNECEIGLDNCGNCNCSNLPGSFECVDSLTHDWDNGVCTLKDPCSDVVCGEDQECREGSCRCIRGEGWLEFIRPGQTECEDKNECMDNFICEMDETCENTPGSYVCVAPPQQVETAPPSICPPGFEHDGYECVDIDECQDDNGGCDAMCINLYGDFKCYDTYDSERPLCHHFTVIDPTIDPYGYECGCYEGYELCEDGFTCTCTGNQYIAEHDDSVECGQCGQFDYEGSCHQVSSSPTTSAAASEDCSSRGGNLVELNSREAWWNIGSQVHNGRQSFWISSNSDATAANMYVVGDFGELVANSPENMAHVPPQWNRAAIDEQHHYVCTFPSGQVAKDACFDF